MGADRNISFAYTACSASAATFVGIAPVALLVVVPGHHPDVSRMQYEGEEN